MNRSLETEGGKNLAAKLDVRQEGGRGVRMKGTPMVFKENGIVGRKFEERDEEVDWEES